MAQARHEILNAIQSHGAVYERVTLAWWFGYRDELLRCVSLCSCVPDSTLRSVLSIEVLQNVFSVHNVINQRISKEEKAAEEGEPASDDE